MRYAYLALAGLMVLPMGSAQAGLFSSSSSSSSDDSCPSVKGDVVIAARTDQVDLFTDAGGTQKAQTMEESKFPQCSPITGRAPNMMLQVSVSGTKYWVPPHMVRYKYVGNKKQPVCRNLAMGNNQVKAGATRGLGEGCPKTGGTH